MGRYNRQRRKHPRLFHRAQRQGRIATGPDRRAAQRQIGHIQGQAAQQRHRIQRQGQSAARSARKTYGREAAFERNIASGSLKGIGPDKAMVRNQLRVGAKQVQQYGKGLSSLALRGAKLDVRDLNQQSKEDIYNTQESVRGIQHQATAEALNTLVSQRRQNQAQAIQDAQAKALDKIQAQRGRQRDRFHNALGLVDDFYTSIAQAQQVPPHQQTPTEKRAASLPLPQSSQDWAHAAEALQYQNPSVAPQDINAAINHYRERMTHHKTAQAASVIDYWRRILGLG